MERVLRSTPAEVEKWYQELLIEIAWHEETKRRPMVWKLDSIQPMDLSEWIFGCRIDTRISWMKPV